MQVLQDGTAVQPLIADPVDHLQEVFQQPVVRINDDVHGREGIVRVLQEAGFSIHNRLPVLIEAFVQSIGKCLDVEPGFEICKVRE